MSAEADFEGIYILTNPSFKEYVKIGKAVKQTIADRVRGLNASSAIPFSFNIYAAYKTNNADRIEEFLHDSIESFKVASRAREITKSGRERVREFFCMDAEKALEYLLKVAKMFGDDHNVRMFRKTKEQINEERIAEKIATKAGVERRQIFTFKRKGIKQGSTIEYIKNSKLKAKVVDDRTVEFENEIYTVTGLAKKFLGKEDQVGGVQGPTYFKYNGIRLFDLPDIED